MQRQVPTWLAVVLIIVVVLVVYGIYSLWSRARVGPTLPPGKVMKARPAPR